jgi:dipeptidyl aminopeptidase/acylaminoacyl peptidase
MGTFTLAFVIGMAISSLFTVIWALRAYLGIAPVMRNADGSNQTRLTDNSAADGGPTWSPDGRRIAFASNHWGKSEITVMDLPRLGFLIRLTDNSAVDRDPAWSPAASR